MHRSSIRFGVLIATETRPRRASSGLLREPMAPGNRTKSDQKEQAELHKIAQKTASRWFLDPGTAGDRDRALCRQRRCLDRIRHVGGRALSDWRRCDGSRFQHAVLVLHDREDPVPQPGGRLQLVQGQWQRGGNAAALRRS